MPTVTTIVGNVSYGKAGQPELKFTKGEKAVLNFNVAVNDRKKVDDEWVDETTWFRATAWESQAENIAASIPNGARVFVHGPFKNREYTIDGDDRKYTALEITVEHVGPELRWATCTIEKNEKKDSNGGGSSNSRSNSNSRSQRQADPVYGDEEPF